MKNYHVGHRARMRARMEKEGMENFAPHEVIEYLLYPVLPQRDVNPLAHMLIEQFGSVGGVLSAPVEELVKVKGIGNKSAQWLGLLKEAAQEYIRQTEQEGQRIANMGQMAQYCMEHMSGAGEEKAWIVCLSAWGEVRGQTVLEKENDKDEMNEYAIVQAMLRFHGQQAVLVRWRKPGNMAFTAKDIEIAWRMDEYLEYLNSHLVDYMLVSAHSTMSMRREYGLGSREEKPHLLAEPNDFIDHWLEE